MKINTIIATLGICLASLFSQPGHAEQYKTLADWDVHYMVIPSTFLQPQIANAYKLQRSKYQAVVNISVLNSSNQKAQAVRLSGTATDLLGKVQKLDFRQVSDGNAIYYIAVLKISDDDRWRFAIDITSPDTTQTLKFEQKVYVE